MEITIQKLIDLLNADVELEYAAAIQYTNHAAVMSGADCAGIIRELENYAKEEIQHAAILSNQIRCLGGVPIVTVAKVHTSKDGQKMLKQDLNTRNNAVKRFKTRIEQAESLQLFVLAQQLRDILTDEESHLLNKMMA